MKKNEPRTVVQLLDFQPQTCRSMDIFLLKLAELLRERGWRTIHIFSGDPPESFRAKLRELESPYHTTDFPISWARARNLARLIRPHRPHTIQTTFVSAFDAPLWWLKWTTRAKHWIVTDQSSGLCSPRTGIKRLAAKVRGALADRI